MRRKKNTKVCNMKKKRILISNIVFPSELLMGKILINPTSNTSFSPKQYLGKKPLLRNQISLAA